MNWEVLTMKSRTSFCNITAIKKDITRFAPVWGLYTIFLIVVLCTKARFGAPAILARDSVEMINFMGVVNIFYGGICAVTLFGDLFVGRLCNALHAFPLRRQEWLISHAISGILFSLIPNVLVAVFASCLMVEYAYMAWIWLAAVTLQFLFFFGTGVFSAVCAGNRLGMIAIYGIIHFITVLVYGVVVLIYQPLLYGVFLDFEKWRSFFPVLHMVDNAHMYVNYSYFPTSIEFQFQGLNGIGWAYIGICSGVGLLSLVGASLVYHRRNLETSGDFISLKPIAPVFLIIYSVGVGTVFYMFSEVFGNASYVYLTLGFAVGIFTGLMLLGRTVNVFTKRSLLCFCALAAVLASSMWITWLDPLGITTKIPGQAKIQWGAAYSTDQVYGYTQKEDYPYRFCVTDADELKSLQQFHERLAADKKAGTINGSCQVRIHYKLVDGSDFVRYYQVEPQSVLGQEVRMRLSDMRYLFQVNETEILDEMFPFVSVECYDMDLGDNWKLEAELGGIETISLTEQAQIKELLTAIRKDAESGHMVQYPQFHENEKYVFYISFEGRSAKEMEYKDWEKNISSQDVYYCGLSVYESCTHTIDYLKTLCLSN